uniref:Uncharacterized protein n=1 Tax=Ackermannviridae sp. TaxID=2831612 RepID=A0A8S5VKJ0_9CAUD|nr:MAG TPA: hypothetical protein [Ackermannviridae sp.]
MDKIVYWRYGSKEDVWHLYDNCPELGRAPIDGTLCKGSVETAIGTGRQHVCPVCRARYDRENPINNTPPVVKPHEAKKVEKPEIKSAPAVTPEKKENVNNYPWVTMAVLALLCCFVWWWSSTPHSSSYDTTATAAVSEDSTETRTTATPRPTARPTATPKPTTKKTSGTFKVTATASVIYNDHVGNDWEYYFEAGDKQLPATVKCCVGDDVSLYAKITEDDSVPDVGWFDGYVTIEDGDFEDGFTTTAEIYVYETSGRYSGNEAKVEVTWRFTPI